MRNTEQEKTVVQKARRTVKKYHKNHQGTEPLVSAIKKGKKDPNDVSDTEGLTPYQEGKVLEIAAFIIEFCAKKKRQPTTQEIALEMNMTPRSIQMYRKKLQQWQLFAPVLKEMSLQILTMFGTRTAFKGSAADVKLWFQLVENMSLTEGAVTATANVIVNNTNVTSVIANDDALRANEKEYWMQFYSSQGIKANGKADIKYVNGNGAIHE